MHPQACHLPYLSSMTNILGFIWWQGGEWEREGNERRERDFHLTVYMYTQKLSVQSVLITCVSSLRLKLSLTNQAASCTNDRWEDLCWWMQKSSLCSSHRTMTTHMTLYDSLRTKLGHCHSSLQTLIYAGLKNLSVVYRDLVEMPVDHSKYKHWSSKPLPSNCRGSAHILFWPGGN